MGPVPLWHWIHAGSCFLNSFFKKNSMCICRRIGLSHSACATGIKTVMLKKLPWLLIFRPRVLYISPHFAFFLKKKPICLCSSFKVELLSHIPNHNFSQGLLLVSSVCFYLKLSFWQHFLRKYVFCLIYYTRLVL